MILYFEIEIPAEDLLIPTGHITGDVGTTAQDGLRNFAAEASGGNDQTLAVLLKQVFVDARARKDATSTHPTQVADAGQFDEVAISGGILRQNNQVVSLLFLGLRIINRSIDDVHLIADDRLDPSPLTQLQQLNRAIHDTVIGERQSRHSKLFGPLNHGGQLRGAIQEAVVAVVVKGDECHVPSLEPNARSSVSNAAKHRI